MPNDSLLQAPTQATKNVPLGLRLAANLWIGFSILSLLTAFSVILTNESFPGWGLQLELAGVTIILDIVSFVFGSGLKSGERWAYITALVFFVISIPFGTSEILYSMGPFTFDTFAGGYIGGSIRILTAIVFLGLLLRGSVRRLFSFLSPS